ncbi:MAG TPA: hypothetical protein VFV38_03890 [Ktedonobacteraceae bacterium]|nr:hypothetical protein [Ktedonobacteraceae bacterium]
MTQVPQHPISSVVVDCFEDAYFLPTQQWLASLGCSFERDKVAVGSYHLNLPPGTVERTPIGRSTQWTYITEIVLLNGKSITKYRSKNLVSGKVVTFIGIPHEIVK